MGSKASTRTLIATLKFVAVSLKSKGPIGSAVINDGADRLEKLSDASQDLLDAVHAHCDFLPHDTSAVYRAAKELERALKNGN